MGRGNLKGEVEENLLDLLALDPRSASETIDVYSKLLQLLKPESVPQEFMEGIKVLG